ncbi:MAG: hypothetical protein NZ932_03380 [Candidatus Bathyarchaeota archaeon]|nr:hypothetical protein [Candidatus Bathyarchaeota archaeon]MDW8041048.1 hypothetical protein [Nitrososphaerota archaeon]
MGERLKVFAFVALLGFFAGIIADITATYVIPALILLLPSLGVITRYMLSGLAGAFLTLILVSIWAYVTGPKET